MRPGLPDRPTDAERAAQLNVPAKSHPDASDFSWPPSSGRRAGTGDGSPDGRRSRVRLARPGGTAQLANNICVEMPEGVALAQAFNELNYRLKLTQQQGFLPGTAYGW